MYATWKIVITIYIVLLVFADHIEGGGYPQARAFLDFLMSIFLASFAKVRALFHESDAGILIFGTCPRCLRPRQYPLRSPRSLPSRVGTEIQGSGPDAGIKVTPAELLSAMKINSINILIVNPLAAFGMYQLHNMLGGKGLYGFVTLDTSPELPLLRTALLQLPVMLAGAEIGFYYSHKWLLNPAIYKYIHKVHHTWNRPSCSVLMGSHIFIAWCFSVFITWHTTSVHSGYHLPLITPSPEFHDRHHRVFGECFGTFGFLDKYHGTCSYFLKSVQYQRHYTILTLKSPRELHPETKKSK